MHVARKRGDVPELRHVLLAVAHGLVQVGDRPAQGDVDAEELGELGRGLPRARVAPGAERHEQVAVAVEGEVAVHHGGDPEGVDPVERNAVLLLDLRSEVGVGGLKAGPDGVERVGPGAVVVLVLPLVGARGEHGAEVVSDEAGLDAGGAELDAERRPPSCDGLARGA